MALYFLKLKKQKDYEAQRVSWKVPMIMMSYLLLITFLDQWDPSTAILKEVCELYGRLCWKINLIWSHSMRVSWSIYELFSWPSYVLSYFSVFHGSVGWGCRIHQLHLCRGVRLLPTSVLGMTLNNLLVMVQCWRFRECGVLLHCHHSQVHSDLRGFYLWIK